MEEARGIWNVFGRIDGLTFKWTNDGDCIASMFSGDLGARHELSKPNEYRGSSFWGT
jgi:hypothetical protein